MGEEEGSGTGVIKLAHVVALDSFNGGTELCGHIRKEVSQGVICVELETKRKHPQVVRTIIKNDQIVFIT
jgi:hypothetical protein